MHNLVIKGARSRPACAWLDSRTRLLPQQLLWSRSAPRASSFGSNMLHGRRAARCRPCAQYVWAQSRCTRCTPGPRKRLGQQSLHKSGPAQLALLRALLWPRRRCCQAHWRVPSCKMPRLLPQTVSTDAVSVLVPAASCPWALWTASPAGPPEVLPHPGPGQGVRE